jgi:hypothetical protein
MSKDTQPLKEADLQKVEDARAKIISGKPEEYMDAVMSIEDKKNGNGVHVKHGEDTANHLRSALTTVIANQIKMISAIPSHLMDETASTALIKRVNELDANHCTICDMPGHDAGHCWLNC